MSENLPDFLVPLPSYFLSSSASDSSSSGKIDGTKESSPGLTHLFEVIEWESVIRTGC